MESVDLWTGAPREPRRWQREALPAALTALAEQKRGVIWATTGCHAKGQLILMADGSVKRVEFIVPGDRLMGPDSTPRTVQRLIRGRDEMFEIRPVKGESWIVNGDHVLSLIDTRKSRSGEITDTTVRNWMGFSRTKKHLLKLFRTEVEFSEYPELTVEPYMLGIFLGDGSFSPYLSFCTMDEEVVDYLIESSKTWNYTLRKDGKQNNKASSYMPVYGLKGYSYDKEEGTLQNALIQLGLRNKTAKDKFIPHEYMIQPKEKRLELIAGLLDTDGHLSHSGFDWISKSEILADDMVFLCRSVGLAAYKKRCKKGCQNGFEGIYYRVSISGNCDIIPNKVQRRKAPPRKQVKDVLKTGFDVIPLGYEDDFFGFEIDGDQRYLLGDFTVTHNSGKSVLLSQLSKIIFEDLKEREIIVISTPTQSLVNQLSETVSEFVGEENVGKFFANEKRIRKVTVTCNPSIAGLGESLKKNNVGVRLLIADEVHNTQAESLRESIPALAPQSRIGFTATPFRSDAKESLELWDEVIYRYSFGDALRDGVLVPFHVKNWDGSGPDDDVDRIVADMIEKHTDGPGIVSAMTIKDAEGYAEALTYGGIEAQAIYGAMKRQEQERRIEMLRTGQIRALVHCQLLAEGVDLPWLRWIALRRPVGSVVRFVQELGRVLRVDPAGGKERAIVLDPHDLIGAFGLSQSANLGESLSEAMEREGERAKGTGEGEARLMPPAKAIEAATSWTRQLLILLQAEGFVGELHASGPWRTRRPSERQVSAILGTGSRKGMVNLTRYLPEPTRSTMKMLCQEHILKDLQRGAVSDIFSILNGLADATREERRAWATGGFRGKRFKFPEWDLPQLDEDAVKGVKAIKQLTLLDLSGS
jgi:hypothetical protein